MKAVSTIYFRPSSTSFIALSIYTLVQYVDSPTHSAGGLLDVVITRSGCNIGNLCVDPPTISDHGLATCTVPYACPASPVFTSRRVRGWKRLDRVAFRNALSSGPLCRDEDYYGHVSDGAFRYYSSRIIETLDQLAPMHDIASRCRSSTPWFDTDCRSIKRGAIDCWSVVIVEPRIRSTGLLGFEHFGTRKRISKPKKTNTGRIWSDRVHPTRRSCGGRFQLFLGNGIWKDIQLFDILCFRLPQLSRTEGWDHPVWHSWFCSARLHANGLLLHFIHSMLVTVRSESDRKCAIKRVVTILHQHFPSRNLWTFSFHSSRDGAKYRFTRVVYLHPSNCHHHTCAREARIGPSGHEELYIGQFLTSPSCPRSWKESSCGSSRNTLMRTDYFQRCNLDSESIIPPSRVCFGYCLTFCPQ